MEERRAIDAFGAAALIGFASLLAFNQVVIKVTGGGFNPVFQAGLRSAGASLVLLLWMVWRRQPILIPRRILPWAILAGGIFSFEFTCLFLALDLTTVSRCSVIFYTMPVWLAVAAHLWLPGEQLTRTRSAGLALAVAGVILALFDRSNGQASLAGDLLALVATLGWAAVALMVRMTPLGELRPASQLMAQVLFSAPLLLLAAPLFGPLVRELEPIHWAGLAFQAICVASLGFLSWFWLLTIYRASSVAAFSFLSPVLAVVFGWALLGERIGPAVLVALVLVAAGIFLINRPARA
ncbi:MAG: EamA family transporter [Pseudooceanicola sp.]|jgi:drug/metabolite transporter (DMT)-like permease|nr:EamA family transporter [Pseudooceanicola sp.]